ncbi:MAG: MbcA/ParS/Xre antitoxin family protein [Nitrospiraceae bacterium]|nr:MbcA/ParS/Xre antitoxin family protein [Nitrospiraceae bacterium]
MKRKNTLEGNKSDPHSLEGRLALTKIVMKLFDLWELGVEDQLACLGLFTGSRRTLDRYRKGAPFANHRDLMDRVGNLLAIHQSLRILYSHNREIVYRWMTTPNLAFDGLRPIDTVREKGFLGLLQVRNYLEFERER